jgi:hypothetical protein
MNNPTKRIGLILIAALFAAGLAARSVSARQNPEIPKLLQAQEFRLVDKDGAARATMALQPDGSPYISLSDKMNNRRIVLRIRPDGGAVLSINDPDGKNRIALDTLPDGSATVSATGKNGKSGAGLLVPADGNPMVVVKDKDGMISFAEPGPFQPGEPENGGKQPQKKGNK